MNTTSAPLVQTLTRFFWTVTFVITAIALLSFRDATTSKAQTATVSAQDVQLWSRLNSGPIITIFGDGSILASSCQSCPSQIISPGTGITINSNYPGVPGAALALPSIRLSNSEQDLVIGGWENQWGFSKDGTQQWVKPVGCCNSASLPWAIDATTNRAYMVGGVLNGLGQIDMSSGLYNNPGPFTFPTFAWSAEPVFVSMTASDNFYLAARTGWVARLSPFNTTQWQTTVELNAALQPGAVAADGSLVVTSGAPHFNAESLPPQPGRLARILSDGSIVFNNFISAVTPPVIGGNGLIFVGIQPAPLNAHGIGTIAAYDLNGNQVWSTQVQGLPNDLLVGDDGAVYAGTGAFNSGTVYVLDQNTGAIRKAITSVPGVWEMKLRAGVLYAAGSAVTALKVDAVNYDSQSPWPLRFHDNQRTSNRMAPILNPPRLPPPPIPVPTPTPGPLCGGRPSYTPGPHVPTPGTYQTGVALGDFNEDGNQDILFSNETTNNVSLRLGDGNGSFSGSTNFSAPDHPWRIVTADFNNDGNLDYAVAGNNSGLSQVRLGNGTGGFDSGTNYQMTWAAAFITTADFNGDGNSDLATSSGGFPPDGIQVAFRLGNGSGGFGPIISVPAGTVLSSIVSADLNGDGWPDLAIADFDDNKIAIRLNDGNGGFVTLADVPVGNGAREIGIGDFNGDGKKDLAVTNELSNTISIRTGNGSGGFSAFTELPAGNHPYALVVSDLDNDGDDDILQSDAFQQSIRVHLGDGLGGFTALPNLVGDITTNVLAVGDFNNDGIKDFASANNQGGPDRVRIWIGSCTLADSVAPSTTASTSVLPNAAGWNNSDVTVNLIAADDAIGSGVSEITYSATGAQPIPSTTVSGSLASFTITGQGETSITYFARDNAGNTETAHSLTIKLDTQSPNISCGTADGLWHATDVSIACTANDTVSGLSSGSDGSFSLSTSIIAGTETANASTNSRTVCDFAYNCANAGAVNGNRIDKKAPTITVTAPTASNYVLNQAVTVHFSCADAGSGIASCTGSSPDGGNLNTSTAGLHTFVTNANDKVGNTAAQVSVDYNVGYNVVALFDQTKSARSGSTIPIKIRLVDANGANVSSPAITVHAISILQVSSQSSSVLQDAGDANPDFDFRYDSSLGGYIFNLKTTGYGTGHYLLNFVTDGSPTLYSVGFQIRL